MKSLVTRVFDYLKGRWLLRSALLAVSTLVLVLLWSGQTYKEDISDFLPLDDKYGRAMEVYQQTAGADRIFVIFAAKGEKADDEPSAAASLTEAVDCFVELVSGDGGKGLVGEVTWQVDLERMSEVTQKVYENIPFFLDDEDYRQLDSLIGTGGFVSSRLSQGKQLLSLPVGGLLAENFQRDPLNIFTPKVSQLQHGQTGGADFETYDGYIFSPDMKRAVVMVTSPFGGQETEDNGRLLSFLEESAAKTSAEHPGTDIHLTGGPAIAVGNAQQIKTDSLTAVLTALVLIVALLLFVFRSVRHLLLILLSIGWGWLFAMGVLSLIHDSVSVIVIGISSVILGIAVNYPLHLIAHLHHTPDVRTALKEIATPIVVGNVTTVGAFMALVPMQSAALRDLGLFSSLLLVGTMLFVLLFLPHMVKPQPQPAGPESASKAVGQVAPGQGRWSGPLVLVLVAATVVFAWFSRNMEFDANISHMNYMTDEQREDLKLFAVQTADLPHASMLYVVSADSTLGGALDKSWELQPLLGRLKQQGMVADVNSCSRFLCSEQEQQRRVELWNSFVNRHGAYIEQALAEAAKNEGFASDAFDDFIGILHSKPQPTSGSARLASSDVFGMLASTVFARNLAVDKEKGEYRVVDVLTADRKDLEQLTATIEQRAEGGQYAFDVETMNSAIANRLSDDFNYIGWACGLIVFVFLWLSMGSLELAILSFMPMALSWVWILGIMAIVGIQFNVVNIILATFIFGQGDDYTIFMAEGCQYEYAYRRKMLSSYKKSISLSAMIMFIGIGSLILAKHPALHSLAEVTIVGMFSVVIMAYVIPPLIFNWLVSANGKLRRRPLSIGRLLSSRQSPHAAVVDRYRYKGVDITAAVAARLKKNDDYRQWIEGIGQKGDKPVVVVNSQWGELPLLIALSWPDREVYAFENDDDKRLVATYSAEGIAPNLHYAKGDEAEIDRMVKASAEHFIL